MRPNFDRVAPGLSSRIDNMKGFILISIVIASTLASPHQRNNEDSLDSWFSYSEDSWDSYFEESWSMTGSGKNFYISGTG